MEGGVRLNGPIGVFDSGVGGLSVLREIRRELPFEDLVYAADSKHAPYGDRPAPFIEARAIAMTEALLARDAKAIVVACNTATSVAVKTLRARWPLPIVAIEPAIKPAATATRSGVVGVLATAQTLASANVERLIAQVEGTTTVLAQPCPGLVEQIERGDLGGAAIRAFVERYVEPLIARGADTLVLGCTHYPLIIDLFRSVAGPDVTIIDPARAVARELRRRLTEAKLAKEDTPGSLTAWSTGDAAPLRDMMALVGLQDTGARS
jgi:glutamate racemase